MKTCDYAFYSDIGGRTNNEDSYLAKKTNDGYLFIVADGLGGHDDGELASRIAIDVIKEGIVKSEYTDLEHLLNEANYCICRNQLEKKSSMKTTVALVLQHEYKTTIAHAGDTRVYAFKQGQIVFQTTDHSVAQMSVCLGETTSEEIRQNPDRNRLTRVLGVKENFKVEIESIPTDLFDSLLICSDGFWEYVLENDMEQTRKDSQEAKKWLYKMQQIQIQNAPENSDNNTAIAVIISDK